MNKTLLIQATMHIERALEETRGGLAACRRAGAPRAPVEEVLADTERALCRALLGMHNPALMDNPQAHTMGQALYEARFTNLNAFFLNEEEEKGRNA